MKGHIQFVILIFIMASFCPAKKAMAQKNILHKDSIVYNISFRDTVIYRYDTIQVKYYVRTDTVRENTTVTQAGPVKRKRKYNPNSWGIGPSVGAYYSPFNGFDMNIGFGIQYYLFAVPSFRNPHMKKLKRN
jgi:hypothetical protein